MSCKGDGKIQNDVAVQGTNDSSIVSKCSMASLGYFQDGFLQFFVSKASRRAPLINRGYYIRAKAIDDTLQRFLKCFRNKSNQIISLGAGFDSAYFRLHANGSLISTSFFEVDFPQLVKRKAALIACKPELKAQLQNPVFHDLSSDSFGVHISSDSYHLLGVDLKNLDGFQNVCNQAGLDLSSPTLLLSECVITYIDTDSSNALINWAAKAFSHAVFVSYEQVYPEDAFGIVMRKHFQKLNSPLNAIQTYSTIEKHCARYRDQGWGKSGAVNMYQYYTQIVSREERRRVEDLELFDEFEEWHLKCMHYIVVAAFNGDCTLARQKLFPDVPITSDAQPTEWAGQSTLVAKPLPLVCQSGIATWLRRFSHDSERIPGTPDILIMGGFGEECGCHRRMQELTVLDASSMTLRRVPAASGSAELGQRMHHTLTALSNHRFLVFGGRTSPAKPRTDTCILTLSGANCQMQYSLHRVQCSAESPPRARWRHTATAVRCEGRESVLVFGGVGVDGEPLGDSWVLDADNLCWSELCLDGATLEPRHSHTTSHWRGAMLVVAGGLGMDATPLSSLMVMNLKSRSCHELKTRPSLHPRYSHTAHIAHDRLVLVGGVCPTSSYPPSLTIINLSTLVLRNVKIQMPGPQCPLMLHNHSSHWMGVESSILLIGGGGNCFSFGTHLNQSPIAIDTGSIFLDG